MNQPCGCCAGIQIVTPQNEANPPGKNSLSYRVGTYATFYETMLARLSTLSLNIPSANGSGPASIIYPLRQLTTRDPSDPSIAMLDAWAIVADVLTFYQERIANEGYLATAVERRSLLELARLVNYTLRPGVSASVYLAFTVQTGFSGVIPAGTRAQSIPGSGQMPQFFETSADLDVSAAWNDLQPRLTRPQTIASNGTFGVDPLTLHALYFQGLSTNLKIGDALIVAAGPEPVLRIVDAVNPQAANQRTQVTLRELPRFAALSLNDVAQRYVTEAASIFQGSDIASQVACQLAAVINNSAQPSAAVQSIQQAQVIATTRNFTRLSAWLSDLLDDLNSAASSISQSSALVGPTKLAISAPPPAVPQPVVSALGQIDKLVGSLALAPSLQPASSIALSRTVAQAFAPQSDIAARLLATFNPAAATTLYQAWANIATPPSQVNVYVARVKAGLFANTFPGAVLVTTRPPTGAELETVGTRTTTSFLAPVLQDALSGLVVEDATGKPSALSGLPLDATYDQITVGSWVAIVRPVVDSTGNATASTVVTTHKVKSLQTASRETVSGQIPTGFTAKVTQLSLDPPWLSDMSQTDLVAYLGYTAPLRGTIIYAQSEGLPLAEEPLDHDVEGNTIELDGLYNGFGSGRWVVVTGQRTDIPNTTGVTGAELVMIAAVSQGTPKQGCVAVPSISIPFTKIYYITPPNAAGDRLVVGEPIETIGTVLSSLPVPNQSGHQPICGPFQIAPGLYVDAYLPTTAERAGNFSDFATDLASADPSIPGGVITAFRVGNFSIYAWRISDVTQGDDSVHTTLVLANSLAYTYDSSTVTIYGNVANATNGQTVGQVLGNGDASQAFQTFALNQSPLTYTSAATPSGAQSTLTVTVNEIAWDETDDLSALGPNDHEYTTKTDNSAKTTVIFGNGQHGARVPTGTANVKAVYRYGIGSTGNVAAGQITQLVTQPLGVQSVTNPLAATGGADPDSPTQARANTPLAVKALDRLVSVQDYADFSRTFAGIGKAASVKLSNGRVQLVFVTIAGAEDIPIDQTSDLYNNLVKALQQYGDPSLPILVGVRNLKLLVIAAGIQVQPNYQFESVEPNVQAALLATFSFDQRNLGQTAFLSEAIAAMQAVQGVAFVNVTIFDSVLQSASAQDLASLGNQLVRRQYVLARPAYVSSSPVQPAASPSSSDAPPPEVATQSTLQIEPAELVYLTPNIADTLILTEITSTNPGPPPNLPKRRPGRKK
jgi:hypothetical protein